MQRGNIRCRKCGKQTFATNLARLAASFRRSLRLSRLFCFYFSIPLLSLFRRYRWRASGHIGESSLFPFTSSCLGLYGLYCVTVRIRFWNFHSGRFRTVVSPRIAAERPVNIASSVIRQRFAILSLRVVSRSRMADREWINAATLAVDEFESVRIERI